MLRRSSTAVNIEAVSNDPHELNASQKAAAGAKTLPVKMDADGCFYGFRFNLLVKKIVFIFKAQLDALQTMSQQDRDQLLESIRDLIAVTNIDEWSNTDASKRPDFESRVADKVLHHYIMNFKLLHPDLLYDILYRVNSKLIDRIMGHARHHHCEVIAFMFATNRHSFRRDSLNARINGTGFFVEDMHHFTRYLNQRFHEQILFMLDRFLLADAYNDMPAGEAFTRAFQHLATPDANLKHLDSILDESKVNILLCLHRIKYIFTGADCVLMFDDSEEVRNDLDDIFQHEHCLQLLPNGLPVTFVLFDGDFYSEYVPDLVIHGTGEVDPNCEHTVRHLLRLSAGRSVTELGERRLTINFNDPDLLARLHQYLVARRRLASLLRRASVLPFFAPEIGDQSPPPGKMTKRFN